jgi:glutamate--cysteine ligase catalytic subunit
MVEGTPGQPYGALPAHLNIVEANMKSRRKEAQLQLPPNEIVLSICNFPRLGCPGFTFPEYNPEPTSSVSRSWFFPDQAIFQGHPRFETLTRNIRSRRGSKIDIHIPSKGLGA